jgi:VanZ family protein
MRWELIVLLAGMVAIPVGCLLPATWLPPLPNDKLLHFVAFGGMALMAGRLAPPGMLAAALLAVLAAGWLIEVLQKWVPGRNFCWRDMAANAAGTLAAGALLLWQAA